MCDNDLVAEWNMYNDILTDCNVSQSEYDIAMRNELEDELVVRGGRFEVGFRDTHVFNGFGILDKITTDISNLEEENIEVKIEEAF